MNRKSFQKTIQTIEDTEIMQNSHTSVNVKKGKNGTVPFHQKTFNRLIKRVQDLQDQQKRIDRELAEALQFYYATILPDESIFLQYLTERINICYECYKKAKGFSKDELKTLKTWLIAITNQACSLYESKDIPTTIKNIFEELNEVGYDECVAQESRELKEIFQKDFKNFFGEDIDLSDVDLADSPEDVVKSIFMKVGKVSSNLQEKSRQASKTKKQIEKDAKKQALENMQAKTLDSMYKQLVRTLHPDLEQDIEKRTLKEELMKKLTVAYEKSDLYSLLKIEMEWMNLSVGKMQIHNDDEVKVYNAILKDQVQELETVNAMLLMHPRYVPIQRFYKNGFDSIDTLRQEYSELKRLTHEVQDMLSRLKISPVKTILEEVVQNKSIACTCGFC